jgi:hypothetical protein
MALTIASQQIEEAHEFVADEAGIKTEEQRQKGAGSVAI